MAKTAVADDPALVTAPRRPAKPKAGGKAPKKVLSREQGAKPPRSLTGEVIAYFDELWRKNPAQLICLAYGHLWPILLPGRGRPAGWSARWRGGGVFGVVENCIRDELGTGETCGRVRESNTARNGIFLDRNAGRQYKNPDGRWLIRPESSWISRRDVIDYLTWMMGGDLFADVQQGEAEPS